MDQGSPYHGKAGVLFRLENAKPKEGGEAGAAAIKVEIFGHALGVDEVLVISAVYDFDRLGEIAGIVESLVISPPKER